MIDSIPPIFTDLVRDAAIAVEGSPGRALSDAAERLNADLVLIGRSRTSEAVGS